MFTNVDECYIEILRLVKQAGSVSRGTKSASNLIFLNMITKYADRFYRFYQMFYFFLIVCHI